jgi:cysteine desulfurase
MSRRIYFDHAATTPISPAVLAEVTSQMAVLGNPSSLHFDGRKVRETVENARDRIAHSIGSRASEVIFVASGTEANNNAIKGIFWDRAPRKVVISTEIEHHAVLDPIHWLVEHEGATLRKVAVDEEGVIDLDSLAAIVESDRENIALISLIHTNNEIGTSIRAEELARIVDIAGEIPIHLDAVQSLGKVAFDYQAMNVMSVAISAHKIGGPLGVAALVLRSGHDITPLIHGGGQERDIRSGTLNAPGIAGFARAVEEAQSNLKINVAKVRSLREMMIDAIMESVSDARINGRGDAPGIINVTFPETENEASLMLFDARGISCSTGSACSQGLAQPSHVLLRIGRSESETNSSLRFSISHLNEAHEVATFTALLPEVIKGAKGAFEARLPSVKVNS